MRENLKNEIIKLRDTKDSRMREIIEKIIDKNFFHNYNKTYGFNREMDDLRVHSICRFSLVLAV